MTSLPVASAPETGGFARRSRRLSTVLWSVVTLLIVAAWSTAAILAAHQEKEAMSQAERDTANLTRIIAEQAARAMSGTDDILNFLAHDLYRFGQANASLRDVMKNTVLGSDLLLQLSFTDAKGNLLQTSIDDAPTHVNLADREHFRVHRDGVVEGLFISRPVFGRASGRWSIQLSRRIAASDGGFGGIIVASIDPFYFTRIFNTLDVGERGIVAMIGLDGILRARSVMDEAIIGQDVSRSALFNAASQRRAGFLRSTSTLDKVTRLLSHRRVAGYPLFVAVGLDEAVFMAETHNRQALNFIAAGIVTLILLVTATVITVQTHAQGRAHAALDHAARRLQANERRYRAMVQAVRQPIITIGQDGRIADFNPAATRLFGYSEAEALGRDIGSLLVNAPPPTSPGTRETEIRRADGGSVPVELSWSDWYSDGQVHFTGIIRDITEAKQLEAELRQARDSAERASQMKSQFLATMSHEIRTPMNAILGSLALLSDAPMEAEEKRLVEVGRQSAEGLLRLLDDILDFSKLEAGKVSLEDVDCSPTTIINGVIAVLRPKAQEKRVALFCHMHPSMPAAVVTDPSRLRQILFNLLGNAIKFTNAGHVLVRGRRRDSLPDGRMLLEFEVEDTGIGITAQARSTLFDRFTQADSSVTRRFGGTGLGLAICKELCTLLGGTIDVHSTPGHGSVFRFTITCREGDPSVLADGHGGHSRSEAMPPLPHLRVLAVDDNAINREIIRRMLERAGHSVQTADNGQDAVEKTRAEHFDLVLMDIQMPIMDGLTATRLIRALPAPQSAVPVIALTAHASGSSRPECLSAGMNGFAAKPLRPHQLFTEIAAVIGGQRTPLPPASYTAPDSGELLDPDQITVMIEALGIDEWAKTIATFGHVARAEITKIRTALDDGTDHSHPLHTLKGLAWNMGARSLGNMVLVMENSSASGVRASLDELDALLARSLAALDAGTQPTTVSSST